MRVVDIDGNNNDKAGDTGIYRFTIGPNLGDYIRVYFPDSVQYTGDPDSVIEICRQYFPTSTPYTEDISDCTYDSANNMIEFALPDGAPAYNKFEVGYLRNPPYSQERLDGFQIQILDSSETVLMQNTQVFVEILPNEITDQSLAVSS